MANTKNKRNDIRSNIGSGLNAMLQPTPPTSAPEPEAAAPVEKAKYKTCNYVTDPSHHRRLKNYATDNGMTLLQAFNEAIDTFLSDKGERYQ